METRRKEWRAWQSVGSLVLAVWFAMWPLVGLAQTPEVAPPPPDLAPVAVPVPGSLGVRSAVTPGGPLLPGQKGQVSLSLFGQSSTDCFGLPVKPVDVVAVMDTSPSAGRPAPGSNFDRAQTILRSLWAQIDQPVYLAVNASAAHSRLAIITVDTGITAPDEVNVRLPFTSTTSTIDAAITGLQNGADSGFDKGIRQAAQLLAEQGRPDAAHVVVILLHDNYFALQEVVKTEVAAARSQAQVFVIGNRLNVREAEQLTAEAAGVLAGSPERVYLDPSAGDLRRLFVAAAEGTPDILGRVFSVYEEFPDASLAQIGPSDVTNGGRVEGNRIVWDSNYLLSSPLTLGYNFGLASSASLSFETAIGVAFVDCNGFLHLYLGGDGKAIATPLARNAVNVTTPTPAGVVPAGTPALPSSQPTTSPGNTTGNPVLPTGRCTIPVAGFRIPCEIFLLLLLLTLTVIASPLLWLLRRGRKQPSPNPPPIAPARSSRPTPTLPVQRQFKGRETQVTGENIRKGRAPDDAETRKALRAATSFSGSIPVEQGGPARGRMAFRAFQSPEDLTGPGGLNLKDMGEWFKWRQGGGEPKDISTDLLQQVLKERVSKTTPLLAGWTREPADNAEIELKHRVDAAARRIVVEAASRYRPPAAGQSQVARAYWLELRFLENPGGYAVEVQSGNEG